MEKRFYQPTPWVIKGTSLEAWGQSIVSLFIPNARTELHYIHVGCPPNVLKVDQSYVPDRLGGYMRDPKTYERILTPGG
jgi:hypothetical protein